MRHDLKRPLLLRGKVVQADGTARDRYVLVKEGVIVDVSRRRPVLSEDALVIETGPNDWIFPGLLDLHSHTDKNVMPIWNYKRHQKEFFGNRFEWRRNKHYRAEVRDRFNAIKKKCAKHIVPAFAEIQAVAGGTTVLQEDWDLDQQIGDGDNPLLCRGTGDASDLALPRRKSIWSVIDFFEPNKGKPVPQTEYSKDKKKKMPVLIEEYAKNRKKLQATLVHLAEGKSGFGSADSAGFDKYSRKEFEAFMSHPALKDAGQVKDSSALAIIHGCGIDVNDHKHIEFLRERNIHVIWSPVSNFLLYGDTLNVEPLIQGGVNVALGSDWSPSGSKHVWDEAKSARYFFEALDSSISDFQIFQMVTTGATHCLGLDNVGRIEKGCLADFFILRSPIESDNPMEVFFKTDDRDVWAVVVGGKPIYGDRIFLEEFGIPLQELPPVEGSAVANKAVHLPEELGINVRRDIDQMEAAFKEVGLKRSNLLVSSDVPYQERISKLQEFMSDFGWKVKKQRRKKSRQSRGIKVAPDSVRVWRGFCQPDALENKERFRRQLGQIFIPCTTQLLPQAGMTAYLPTVLPDEIPQAVPDEIALVFYRSQEAYSASFGHTGARVQGLLHQPVFSFEKGHRRSLSGFPKFYSGKIKFDQAYYLFEDSIDWYFGETINLVGSRPEKVDTKTWKEAIAEILSELQKNRPRYLEAGIFAASEEYVVFWEHWNKQGKASAALRSLKKLANTEMCESAARVSVPQNVVSRFSGLPIEGGEFFNMRFHRE